MPDGKPAGVACIHLDENLRCLIFGKPERPAVCLQFQPQREVCGDSQAEATRNIQLLELATRPD